MDPQVTTFGTGAGLGAAILYLAQRWLPVILERLFPRTPDQPRPPADPRNPAPPVPPQATPWPALLEQLVVLAIQLGNQYLEQRLKQPPAPPAK